jgi:DNA-directed RNA polymerase specialized sigma24 family protein
MPAAQEMTNDDDRTLYERTKRELAARTWKYMQNYADAKSDVVAEILDRALGANDRQGPHDSSGQFALGFSLLLRRAR